VGKANSLKKSLHSSEMNERRPVDMSQKLPPKIPISDADLERYIDRPFDLVARVRAAKEAAQREMETFGNVSEYEIRKIYGQKSELSYDSLKDDPSPHQSSIREDHAQIPVIEHGDKSQPKESQSSFDFAAQETAPQDAGPEEE
jgi:hypothetical protein